MASEASEIITRFCIKYKMTPILVDADYQARLGHIELCTTLLHGVSRPNYSSEYSVPTASRFHEFIYPGQRPFPG